MAYSKWLNVKMSLQSAIGTAVTVTAVSKASVGVVSAAAHGFTNGSYVLMTSNGMTEIHQRVFRVANTTAGTFELEGEDTTNYTTFTSGTVQLITYGLSYGTIKTVSTTGGEADSIDVTTIHDSLKKSTPGLFSEISMDFESFWDINDPAIAKSIVYSNSQSQASILFSFPTGQKIAVYGYVSASGIPTGSSGDMVMTKIAMKASSFPKYYIS